MEPQVGPTPDRPRSRLRLTIGVLMLLMAIVGPLIGFQARRIANVQKARKLQPIARVPIDGLVAKIAWSPDRRRLALVRVNRPLEVRDATNLERLGPITPADKWVDGFAFATSGSLYAYQVRGEPIRVVDRGREVALEMENVDSLRFTFSPDGKWLATGGYGSPVGLWRVADGAWVREYFPSGGDGGLTPVFSPDGCYLAVGNRNDVTDLFDVATGRRLVSLPIPMSQELAFSPDGRTLAVCYVDGTFALWSVPDGRLLRKVKTPSELYSVDWSPDGLRVVTSGDFSDVTVWETSTLKPLRAFTAARWVGSVKFGPDGRSLIYAGGDVGSIQTRKSHLGIFDVPGGFYADLKPEKP